MNESLFQRSALILYTAVVASLAAPAAAQTGGTGLRVPAPSVMVPAAPPATQVSLVNAFPGVSMSAPITLATVPGDSRVLMIGEKGGILRRIPDVTANPAASSIFLNLPPLLQARGENLSTSSENGLLGVAFHPKWDTNGYFYVFYSVTVSSVPYQRLSRFSRSSNDPSVADLATERVLIQQRDDYTNHNGGCLQFGPDGYLYVSLGDEGDQNDAGNNSQRINKDFFSGILRIDVDKRPGNPEPSPHPNPADYPNAATRPADAVQRDAGIARYSIPVDNPWVPASAGGTWTGVFNGTTLPPLHVRTEFWATGLRNPWRMSFDADPAAPGSSELWTGDVGGGLREEINLITKGKNYGWAYREGFTNGPKSAQAPANFDNLYGTRPLYEYRRQGTSGVSPTLTGNSVTGGVVYRGSRFRDLSGAYIFADYVSGNVWSLRRNGSATPTVVRIATEGGIAGFGLDPSNGDVLAADLDNNRILRVISVPAGGSTFPQTLSATGLFSNTAELTPAAGVLPYGVNLPFWSDFALKRRWFTIPDGTSRMTWSREGAWTFPTGQVWVKHFDLEATRGSGIPSRRLETRLLVKQPDGVYGVSYRWNEAGTDAVLVPDEGMDLAVPVTVDGTPVTQTWQIPSRGQCLICHTPQAGLALSFNTRQLHRDTVIPGQSGNQLTLLANEGYFQNSPEPPAVLPRHVAPTESSSPLESRVRSYLDVNCSYCHRAGGTTPTGWDVRASIPHASTGLILGQAANSGQDPLNRLIVPGDPVHSIVLSRMSATNGFTRMPPLATLLPDPAGIALLTEWIQSLPARLDYASWRIAQFPPGVPGSTEPTADPDGDGFSNSTEFLSGTSPTEPGSLPRSGLPIRIGNGMLELQFVLPDLRCAQIEISSDLSRWSLWNAPANHPGIRSAGTQTISGPVPPGQAWFRIRITEP